VLLSSAGLPCYWVLLEVHDACTRAAPTVKWLHLVTAFDALPSLQTVRSDSLFFARAHSPRRQEGQFLRGAYVPSTLPLRPSLSVA
jgi:hypothetical protein